MPVRWFPISVVDAVEEQAGVWSRTYGQIEPTTQARLRAETDRVVGWQIGNPDQLPIWGDGVVESGDLRTVIVFGEGATTLSVQSSTGDREATVFI